MCTRMLGLFAILIIHAALPLGANGQGCSARFIEMSGNQGCFKIFEEKITATEAKSKCDSNNLVMVGNDGEFGYANELRTALLSTYGEGTFWLAAESATSGYRWFNGDLLDYQNPLWIPWLSSRRKNSGNCLTLSVNRNSIRRDSDSPYGFERCNHSKYRTICEEKTPKGNTAVVKPTTTDCSFDGATYHNGNIIRNKKVCAHLLCDGGQFKFIGYDKGCESCMTYLDPHILTYDQYSDRSNCNYNWTDPNISNWVRERCKSYIYQHCGKFSLSQSDNTDTPTSAVYATFVKCGGSSDEPLSCVETVHFKNDKDTEIEVVYNNSGMKIKVNGVNVLISSSPSMFQSIASVLAWTSTYTNLDKPISCVNIQGSSGFMVRYCGDPYNLANSVVVLAHPDAVKPNGVKHGLYGLCGNANANAFDDLNNRAGAHRPPQDPRWQVPSGVVQNCPNRRRRRRELKNCTLDEQLYDSNKGNCRSFVGNGFSSNTNLKNNYFEDCVYDLCNVDDPIKWIETIKATVEVTADLQKNMKESRIPPRTSTYEYKAPTTVSECKYLGWHTLNMGTSQEERFLIFDTRLSWTDARAHCKKLCRDEELDLYVPVNYTAVAEYLFNGRFENEWYWLGIRGNGTNQVTLDNKIIPESAPWRWHYVKDNDCTQIIAQLDGPIDTVLVTHNCTSHDDTFLCGQPVI